MAKRANGEGTISKRKKDGKVVGWKGSVTVGTNPDGSLDRRWVSGKTQDEVREKIRALQSDLHRGLVADTEGLTLSSFMDRWLDHKERSGVKPNTLESYRYTTRRNINPNLGKIKLEKLRPLDVEHLLTTLTKAGKSAANVSYTLRVLKMALRQGVRWQMLPRNVADAVSAPKVERREMQVWTPEQVATFLGHTEPHRLHAAFYLALMTGMRRGEVMGLRWHDIDLDNARLTIRHNLVEVQGQGVPGKLHNGKPTETSRRAMLSTPKTKASRRSIRLSPGTVSKLKEHQARQEQERRDAGEAWLDEGWVFASPLGGMTTPDYLTHLYDRLVKEAGVPRIRFHDLRHTAASLMIRQGVIPKAVSERLGHTDVSFTLRTYTHLYDDQRDEAAFDLIDLFPTAQGVPN